MSAGAGDSRVSLLVSDRTREVFGPEVLDELSHLLCAVDCQSCGRPFRGVVPALCVDDLQYMVQVSLHHEGCRRPSWNDGMIFMNSSPVVTYVSSSVLVDAPVVGGDWALSPLVLVNPSAESLHVVRDESGGWRVGDQGWMLTGGFSRVDESRLDVPVASSVASARLVGGDQVVVTTMGQEWSAPINPEIRAAMQRVGMFMLVVTPLMRDGEDVTPEWLVEILQDDRSVSACVGLAGYEPPPEAGIPPCAGSSVAVDELGEREGRGAWWGRLWRSW